MGNEKGKEMNLKKTYSACPTQYSGWYKGRWYYIRYRYGVLRVEIYSKKGFEGKCYYSKSWQIGDELDGQLKPYYYRKVVKAIEEGKLKDLWFKEYSSDDCKAMAHAILKGVSPWLAKNYKKSCKWRKWETDARSSSMPKMVRHISEDDRI